LFEIDLVELAEDRMAPAGDVGVGHLLVT
jgi:hypothetical protein